MIKRIDDGIRARTIGFYGFQRAFFTDTEYSYFFCVFASSCTLTIVHCNGTSILSLYTSKYVKIRIRLYIKSYYNSTCNLL
jgi:hypothetical protein